jgi:hypothetical protein
METTANRERRERDRSIVPSCPVCQTDEHVSEFTRAKWLVLNVAHYQADQPGPLCLFKRRKQNYDLSMKTWRRHTHAERMPVSDLQRTRPFDGRLERFLTC